MTISSEEIIQCLQKYCGLEIFHQSKIIEHNEINTDSRTIKKNDIFIALSGSSFNGADFVEEVLHHSPSIIIINQTDFKVRRLSSLNYHNTSVFLVKDTLYAYGQLSALYLSKLQGIKIAVTGSAGKTSVKDFFYQLVHPFKKVFKSEKNYNNLIGLPKNIFNIKKNNYDIFIFEIGTNTHGEIQRLSEIISPDLTVITNILSAHIGKFGSKDEILNEKLSIIKGMKSNEKTLLLPSSTYNLPTIIKTCQSEKINLKQINEKKITLISYIEENKIKTSCHIDKKNIGNISLHSSQHGKNLSIAWSIATCLKIPEDIMKKNIIKITNTNQRFNINHLKETIIIDDVYNANMESMLENIDWVMNLKTNKRKIFILGDIFETGEMEKKIHIQIGAIIRRKYSSHNNVQFNFVGKSMRHAFKSSSFPDRQYFLRTEEISNFIKDYMEKDAIYYLKASNGMSFYKIIRALENALSLSLSTI